MIEPGNLRLWAQQVLWLDPAQVEQDLVLSRALYQRRKGRDLFDLHVALERFPNLNRNHILKGFHTIMDRESHPVSWRIFELNLQKKVEHSAFASDIKPLLATGDFNPVTAWSALAPLLLPAWSSA